MLITLLQKFIDFIYLFIAYNQPDNKQLNKVKLVAHRGVHDNLAVKENTMKAFQLGLENKIDAIEFDIRWTKDLVPIVHHDLSLMRIFDSEQKINEITFKELRLQFPQVPSLSEVVQSFGKKVHFFVELKQEYFPDIIKQKEILRQVLESLNPVEDFHFMTLHEEVFKQFDNFPNPSYLLVAKFNLNVFSQTIIEQNWGGITGHYLLMKDQQIQKHHALNQIVGTGFPKNKNTLKREILRGVDYIFTNQPINLKKILKEMQRNQ